MAEKAEYPFDGYTLYKVFHKKEGRMMAQLVKSKADRTTMSYARYLMSVHLKRILEKDEHVDHINNDKTDDVVTNFQILTLLENKLKYEKLHPKILYNLVCPVCNRVFQLTKQRLWHNKKPCCSRICGRKKSALTKLSKKSNTDVSQQPSKL